MPGAWPTAFKDIGFVTGLWQEARIARRLGGVVAVGGGTEAGARRAAQALADRGVKGLVSFGLAGGLDPALEPGAVLVPARVLTPTGWIGATSELAHALGGPTAHSILGGSVLAGTWAEKQRLHAATGCNAIDLESGAVAELARARGLPMAVLRAVCDPAGFSLPPAARLALSASGTIRPFGVLASVLREPTQIPRLLRLARHANHARYALVRSVEGLRGEGALP